MRLAVPKEVVAGERRVALVPETCKKLIKVGAEIAVEAGAGLASYFSDEEYRSAGATIVAEVAALLAEADFVLKVQPPVE